MLKLKIRLYVAIKERARVDLSKVLHIFFAAREP